MIKISGRRNEDELAAITHVLGTGHARCPIILPERKDPYEGRTHRIR